MPLILIAAAASFACINPRHHDGDAIRCDGQQRSMRLHAIDAPEMPGACRPGRRCTPGDPFQSRDHLAGLTRGRTVECRQVDTDNYGRSVVDCAADGRNLGCDMVAAGMAVERYGTLDCASRRTTPAAMAARLADVWRDRMDTPSRAEQVDLALPGAAPPVELDQLTGPSAATIAAALSWLSWPVVGLWLLVTNGLAFIVFAVDKRRAQAGRSRDRIPEARLLFLAAIGGSGGAVAAQQILRHKTRKQPFANRLLLIVVAHLGIMLALSAPTL